MSEPGWVIKPRTWVGWLEMPPRHPGWAASPVWMTAVMPLKSGKGILRLDFVHAVRPVAAARRRVDLRVLARAPSQITGTFVDENGQGRTAILCAIDFDWLATFCPVLMHRRPPARPSLLIDGKPMPGPTPQQHLEDVLGGNEARVLAGAMATADPNANPPMPAQASAFDLNVEFAPFDSWMIARGFEPAVMEEKWRVNLDGSRLLWRRSWTGNLIYEIEVAWSGDRLRLGRVRVNRDPAQYIQTSDEQDRRLLVYLISVVLLNEPAAFPAPDGTTPGQAAVQAWSVAGKASL
ncbi:MAG: hypothetical protein IT557_08625 [Alphaproteobacteria bacterium]|nr:hypothetical protein [Alphaproteobacteria bacterium]